MFYTYTYILCSQTAAEFSNAYENNLRNNRSEPSAALAYDAVWALALALNKYVVHT